MNKKISENLTEEDYLYLMGTRTDIDHKLVKYEDDYYLLDNEMARTIGDYFMERLLTGELDLFRVDSENDTVHDGFKILGSTREIPNIWKLDRDKIEALLPKEKTYTNEDIRASMLFMANIVKYNKHGTVSTFLDVIDKYSQAIRSEWIASIQMKDGGSVISGGLRASDEIGGKGLQLHTTWIPHLNNERIVINSIK